MLIWSDLIVSQWPRLITGHGFDFDIAHAVALDLGEVANLLLREADVLDLPR